MARLFTLSEMRTRALQFADMEVSGGFISTAEANDAINEGIAFVWDELVRLSPGLYSIDHPLTTSSGTIAYALPGSFRSEVVLYSVEGSLGERRPIAPINDFDRGLYKAPSGAHSLVLEYIPSPAVLTLDAQTFDGIIGYEKAVCAHAARRFLAKEESDLTAVQLMLNEELARMARNFTRTRGPRYLTDVETSNHVLYPNATAINGYRIRAATIELYENAVTLWGAA